MKRRRLFFTATLAALVLAALAVSIVAFLRTDGAKDTPAPFVSVAVTNARERLVRTLGGESANLEVTRIDARKLTVAAFRRLLEAGEPAVLETLWMPGASDWLLVRHRDVVHVKLADMLERFAEEECVDSLPGLFAGYAGERREIMSAFASLKAGDAVVCEMFVPREIPEIAWLDEAGVDADIVRDIRAAIRSVQFARRIALGGNLLSREGKTEACVGEWAKAMRRNPHDPMMLERLEQLRVNAEVFLKVAKPALAARCYETMAEMRPNDPAPVRSYAECMRLMGRKDLKDRALRRAARLEEEAKRAAR